MRLALTQLMQSFHLRAAHLVPPVVLARHRQAAVCRHQSDQSRSITAQQYGVAPAATDSGRVAERRLEGISMDCLGLASIQATQSGLIEVNCEKIPALRSNRLSDGQPLTIYPGEVPARLPGQAFWQQQGASQFENFRPQASRIARYLAFAAHSSRDAGAGILIGDKLAMSGTVKTAD